MTAASELAANLEAVNDHLGAVRREMADLRHNEAWRRMMLKRVVRVLHVMLVLALLDVMALGAALWGVKLVHDAITPGTTLYKRNQRQAAGSIKLLSDVSIFAVECGQRFHTDPEIERCVAEKMKAASQPPAP